MAVVEKVERVAKHIDRDSVIAHIRLSESRDIIRAINSLLLGGVSIIELSFQAPKWKDILQKARAEFGDEVTVGVGGILDRRGALTAVQTGADYVSCPHTERGIVELCKEEGAVCMQGALTPNEVYRAQQTGADYVTVLPAGLFGSEYLETLLYNYGDCRLVPMGGIDDKIAGMLLKAGARAVVADTWLVNDQMVGRRQFDEIQRRAAQLMKIKAKKNVVAA